jgi:hypothetical protein
MKTGFLTSILLVLLSLVLVPANASAGRHPENLFCHDSIYYYIDEGAAIVTYRGDFSDSYNEYSGDVVIPSTVNGYDVVGIDGSAFQGCYKVRTVFIPGSVKWIGACAFDGCEGLTKVTMEEGVETIGIWAFRSCES